MLRSVSRTRTRLAAVKDSCRAVAARFQCLLVEREASTVVEYALTLAGIALSASGLTAAIGFDVASVFADLKLEFCKQAYSVCLAR